MLVRLQGHHPALLGPLILTFQVGTDLGKMCWYTFMVTTSTLRGAGTDADVHVCLHGDLGDTPTTVLPSRPEHFERGQTDTFR